MTDQSLIVALLLLSYLCVTGLAAWFVFFPTQRKHVLIFTRVCHHRLLAAANTWTNACTTFSRFARRALKRCFSVAQGKIFEQRYIIFSAIVLIVIPVLVALSLRKFHTLEGFDDSTIEPSSVVSWLLRGEQLVPPPPLPPEIFVTKEVELFRPALGSASRDWALLDERFRQRLLQVFKIMAEQHGYQLVLLEGYRSPERQNMLANLGTQVTNARAFQSYHQFGLAADIAFFRDGKLVISEADPWAMRGYRLFGEVAEKQGMVWGGRWKLMDFGHVELRAPR